MKLSTWDRLVLNITGRLPEKTQAKVDEENRLLQLQAEHRVKVAAEARAQHIERLRAEAALAEKAAKKLEEVKSAAKPQTGAKPTPKKATPKKQAELKAKPKPAPKKKGTK